ncbi:MAG: translational GTPase TypA [Candidatus Brocadiales bacterium]
MRKVNSGIRNIAIIAHVDHGKTTLVDQMLIQTEVFRANQRVMERILDSNDQERERGITIIAKNISVNYKGVKINIIDTPGHADFGGEVERVLKMADSVLLLVDAFEGPMPQTKYVLRKALGYNLRPIVVINKIDRADSQPEKSLDEIFDLFVELNASDEQLDFPVVYASAKNGVAKLSLQEDSKDITPLFDAILKYVPEPDGDLTAPLQVLVASLDYNDFVGRIGIGRIFSGTLRANQQVICITCNGEHKPVGINELYTFQGMGRKPVSEAFAGDIVAFTGIEDVDIGNTIASVENPQQLPSISIDEPTLSMVFSVNNSPFSGRDGSYVTSRNLRERLYRELRSNVALRVEDTASPDALHVSGRGLLHLSVLIESMRREGYELQVSRPKVIYKNINGKKTEPIEYVVIDVPDEYSGQVISLLGGRRGDMLSMESDNGHTHLEFNVPSRGFIGLRNRMLSVTRGEAVMYNNFYDYEPIKGYIPHRTQGVIVSMATGDATAYAIDALSGRGVMFIEPGIKVYEGMIVGEHCEENDIAVNICKCKKATNIRSSTADKGIKLQPPRILSLEMALEYIKDDELLEVTPKTFRLRKKTLKEKERRRTTHKEGEYVQVL